MAQITTTRETKVTMRSEGGRIVAWSNDREPGTISLAVPGERVKMTPGEIRALIVKLEELADAEASRFVSAAARAQQSSPYAGFRMGR